MIDFSVDASERHPCLVTHDCLLEAGGGAGEFRVGDAGVLEYEVVGAAAWGRGEVGGSGGGSDVVLFDTVSGDADGADEDAVAVEGEAAGEDGDAVGDVEVDGLGGDAIIIWSEVYQGPEFLEAVEGAGKGPGYAWWIHALGEEADGAAGEGAGCSAFEAA